jgi:hypothetical protein
MTWGANGFVKGKELSNKFGEFNPKNFSIRNLSEQNTYFSSKQRKVQRKKN